VQWIGLDVRPGPCIYYGAEEDEEEIVRRLADIAAHYGVTLTDLEAGGLHTMSFVGGDALLAIPDRGGQIAETAEYKLLLEAAGDVKPVSIIIDTRNDTFGGDEINRTQVRQYVGLLRKLSMASGGSVSMCDHPSLTGITSGTGLSGSTAWHNSVRARAYFRSLQEEKAEPGADAIRELRFLKNQYGREEDPIHLRWEKGVFVPVAVADKIAAQQAANSVFLTILVRFNMQGRNAGWKAGPSYAPKLFAQEHEAKERKIGKDVLATAMNDLLRLGKIKLEPYGRSDRGTARLVVANPPTTA
jgi:RecA-family ATPase